MFVVYKEMVDFGEFIDIVVLNCFIFGFLCCGDEGVVE